MVTPQAVQWTSIAALLGGVAFVAEALAFATTSATPIVDVLLLFGYILTAGGLFGFYLLQAGHIGRLGQVGFLIALIGSVVASIATAAGLAGISLDLLHGLAFLALFVGYAVFGIATFRAHVVPPWCGWALILVFPLGLLVGEYTTAVVGLIWLALGYVLWTRRDAIPRVVA